MEAEVLLSRPDSKDLRDFAKLTTAFDRGFERRSSSNLYKSKLKKKIHETTRG